MYQDYVLIDNNTKICYYINTMSEADPGLTPQTGPNIQNQDPTLTPEAANPGRINPLEIAATGIGDRKSVV